MVGLKDIASWKSEFGTELGGKLIALLVSSSSDADPRGPDGQQLVCRRGLYAIVHSSLEIRYVTLVIDCADTSVVRTTSRQELLFVRSQIVITAKAFGLEAIDMAGQSILHHFGV